MLSLAANVSNMTAMRKMFSTRTGRARAGRQPKTVYTLGASSMFDDCDDDMDGNKL